MFKTNDLLFFSIRMNRNYLVTVFPFSYIKGIICKFWLHHISKEKSHEDPSPCPNI